MKLFTKNTVGVLCDVVVLGFFGRHIKARMLCLNMTYQGLSWTNIETCTFSIAFECPLKVKPSIMYWDGA